jgi:hypothetical protein
MLFIAHRGLFNGPDSELENRPEQIDLALSLGFHCEIDVRYINGKWMLGHDKPTYEIPFNFLQKQNLWIHAKNLEALYQLSQDKNLKVFWHQNDDFTLTSSGEIWSYPNMPLTPNSIMLMPEWTDPNFRRVFDEPCLGICSDFVSRIYMIYQNR